MYKGIIELESLNDPTILKEMDVIKECIESRPEAIIKIWHVYKVEVMDSKIKLVVETVSKVIKKDWYSIFWNDYGVYAVFSGKVFLVSRKDVTSGEYEQVKKYGINQGVQEKFINLQKEIDSW